MKIQKFALSILVMFALVAGSHVKSFAASVLCLCTVQYSGPMTSSGYKMPISLNYSAGNPVPTKKAKTFYAPAGYEKEYLAVALAAISNGKKVWAKVDFDGVDTKVYNLYLTNQ